MHSLRSGCNGEVAQVASAQRSCCVAWGVEAVLGRGVDKGVAYLAWRWCVCCDAVVWDDVAFCFVGVKQSEAVAQFKSCCDDCGTMLFASFFMEGVDTAEFTALLVALLSSEVWFSCVCA